MLLPSGKVILNGGISFTSCSESTKIEGKLNNFPHFLGFFALATLPVCLSIIAYVRSPMSPRSVTYEELSSSPIIDLTGYRHKDTTVPVAAAEDCWFTNSHHHPSCLTFRQQFSIYGLCSKIGMLPTVTVDWNIHYVSSRLSLSKGI